MAEDDTAKTETPPADPKTIDHQNAAAPAQQAKTERTAG
jgi:hypothetical protein